MIALKLLTIPWATLCVTKTYEDETIRRYLTHYIFGIRVARFHLDR